MINNPRYLIYRQINLFAPVRNNIIMMGFVKRVYVHTRYLVEVYTSTSVARTHTPVYGG